jgi:hypothetical protein
VPVLILIIVFIISVCRESDDGASFVYLLKESDLTTERQAEVLQPYLSPKIIWFNSIRILLVCA